jgi:hypothetical protein
MVPNSPPDRLVEPSRHNLPRKRVCRLVHRLITFFLTPACLHSPFGSESCTRFTLRRADNRNVALNRDSKTPLNRNTASYARLCRAQPTSYTPGIRALRLNLRKVGIPDGQLSQWSQHTSSALRYAEGKSSLSPCASQLCNHAKPNGYG